MINHIRSTQVVKQSIVIISGVLLLAALMLGLTTERRALAATGVEMPEANSSVAMPDTATWISCVSVEVMAYEQRIHIRCQTAVGGISYFALGTSNTTHVARVLSVLTTAQVAGRTLGILYDPADLSGQQIGCSNSDCRLILAAGFGP
ncbi:MAG TPA: hypothetical protein VFF59_09795 [Anaerolineae bacterium]|nr:hypothetical protein [Anaerolineae bacterium]